MHRWLKPRPHNNSMHRQVHAQWHMSAQNHESNDRVHEPPKAHYASGKPPSRYAGPQIPNLETCPHPAYITLQVPEKAARKVTERNLHLTWDISGGFLTFLARCVPCVEFPSCCSSTAALTLWNSWPPAGLNFSLIEVIFTSRRGKICRLRQKALPLLINAAVITKGDRRGWELESITK